MLACGASLPVCGQTESCRSEVLGKGFAVSSPQAQCVVHHTLMESKLSCGGRGKEEMRTVRK